MEQERDAAIIVQLTPQHLNVILNGLAERPFREVADVINFLIANIEQQKQQKQQKQEPPAPEAAP